MYVELSGPDERLQDYTSLTDVALRKKLETERGLYLAESTNVVMRAIQAGHKPRSFLTAPKWLPTLEPWIEQACGSIDGGETPIYLAGEDVLEQITGFHLHRGALAAMHRPALPTVADIVKDAKVVAVIEDLVDHTNVGAIFRSCAALGVDAVLVSPGCADPLYRRSVRVSMGAVFQVPWTRFESWQDLEVMTEEGWKVAALALTEESVSLAEFTSSLGPEDRVALLLGTEGHGLSKWALRAATHTVRIPMAGGVDSLNVAAASAVASYVITQALHGNHRSY